ncbi:MAG: hypothetical protein E7409_03855 [Ruminococcaceae bacterium]|nr:hypothetical protein [Oscillospiraceae bacterium]
MKRLISLLVTLAMLAGMCVSVGAALPATTEYAPVESPGAELKTPFSHYVANAYENEFVPGKGLAGKEQDLVYKITTTKGRSDAQLRLTDAALAAHTTYEDGEKVHMTTEIMIPSGTEFYYLSSPAINVEVLTGEKGGELTANGIGVKNKGAKSRTTASNLISGHQKQLVVFNTTNKHFELFGRGVYTDTSWEYDQWYRFDIVLTMGSNPRASIYVDGEPMRINVDYGNGVGYHHNDSDATFDGSRTTSEDVKIGYYDSSWNYFDTGIWGVKGFCPVVTVMGPTQGAEDFNTIYADNVSYKVLAKGVEANIPEALGIAGYADGATVDPSLLNEVTVNPPSWSAHKVSKVTLSVDGATAQEDTEAPYTFDLSNLERGVRHITLTAYDSQDLIIKQRVQTMVVAGNEKRIYLDENFNEFANTNALLSGKFYGRSTRVENLDGTTRNITLESVTDSTDVTHEKAVKIFSNGADVDFKWGANPNSADSVAGWPSMKQGSTGLMKVEYDVYLSDMTNVSKLYVSLNNNGANYVIWDAATQKFTTFDQGGWAGINTSASFDPVVGKWHKWQWEIDHFKGKASLWVDGQLVLDRGNIHSATAGLGDGVGFTFNVAEGTGAFMAVDNMKVSSETAPATIEKVMKSVNSGTLYSTMDWATQIYPNEGFIGKNGDAVTLPAGATASGVKGAVVYGEDGETPLNANFGESLVVEFSDQDTVGASSQIMIPIAIGVGQYNDTSPHFTNTVVEFDMYRSNTNHGDFAMAVATNVALKVAAGTSRIKVNPQGYYDSYTDMAVGQWQHHRLEFDYSGSFAGPLKYYVDGKLVYHGSSGYNFTHETSRQGRLRFMFNGAKDETTGKFKPCKFAIDNVKVNYTPIVPYIHGVDFGTGNGSGNLVKAGTMTPVVNITGHGLNFTNLATLLTVTDEKGNPATMGTPVGTSNYGQMGATISLTDLVLEPNKTYTIKLAAGLPYDGGRAMKTHEPMSYTFKTVAELPTVTPVPGDGVAGDITVTGVRMNSYGPYMMGDYMVEAYAGGEISNNRRLRADVLVSNASEETQTFRAIIATYSDGKLTNVSLGEPCVVNPLDKNVLVSSGEVTVIRTENEDEEALDQFVDEFTAKAFLVNDMATFTPISYSYDIFGNIASVE